VIVYLDTSAAAKLVVHEEETHAVRTYLDAVDAGDEIASSILLLTELRRLAVRAGLEQQRATAVLDQVRLVLPDAAVFAAAGLLPDPLLRSLDALHLATAVRVEAEVLVAFDQRLLSAARDLGMRTVSPS